MTDLRKLAKERECQVRIPGTCDGNRFTTVLAHYRLSGISGMGMKSPDLIGAWACAACHRMVDGVQRPPKHLSKDAIRLMHAEGVFRTQAVLLKEGVI